jgi:hypothetical protein
MHAFINEWFSGLYAAKTADQRSGAVTIFSVSGLMLNFLIFSANSMPRLVKVAVSNRLNPSIGRIRCFTGRLKKGTITYA